MKIQINHNVPVPSMAIIGCAKSFGIEKIEIIFGEEWNKLKKHINFYLSDDNSEFVTLKYKKSPVKLPDELYEKPGVYKYVIVGEGAGKKIVSQTGYLTVKKSPEDYIKRAFPASSKKRGDTQ